MRRIAFAAFAALACTILDACFGGSSGTSGSGAGFDAGLDTSASFDTGSSDRSTKDASEGEGGPAADAGADVAPDAPVVWPDAGTGCSPPTGPSGLSPTAEGLPASGLVLWLRGDRGVYTAAADAGAQGGDASAPPVVCGWADQSGNGWLFVDQSTTLPTFAATGVGGQPAIWLQSGSGLQTTGVLGLAPTSPRTLIAVEALVAGDGRFDPILQGQTGTAGTYLSIDANTWMTVGSTEGVYVTSNSIDSNTATSTGTARVHVFTVSSMTPGTALSSALDYRINGTTQTLTVRQGNGMLGDFTGADFTAVGPGLADSTGIPGSGMVAEVLVYGRALDGTERATVESVLKARYGIP